MSYQHLFRSHYTTSLASVKSLSEVDRERLGHIDIEDADTTSIENTPSKRFTLSPSTKAGRSPSSVRQGSAPDLIRIHEPNAYLDFGILVCEEKNEERNEEDAENADDTVSDNSRRAQSISALKRDALILSLEQPRLDFKHILRYLRVGIRNLPKLPTLPDDCPLTRLYHDEFDPEIAVIPKEPRLGQKRKFESQWQPLVQLKSPTEEGQFAARLYYVKGTRWWQFSPQLLRLAAAQQLNDPRVLQPVLDAVARHLVLYRDDSTTL
ncbi:hypothetical protein F4680DRAFT_437548 [Xylaria scruposa]|nr:hypothetical protein F4680DRAFT_437548 [Xylaria scruposa]